MRPTVFFVALALLAPAGQVAAQQVSVSIGPDLAEKAEDYGQDDIDRLQMRLQSEVADVLTATGRYEGARVALVLEDAVPNRPTFAQLRDRPGLSMESFGIGGADISGEIVMADGRRIPVAYRWYETNIANVSAATTWSDANRVIDRFANRLARDRF